MITYQKVVLIAFRHGNVHIEPYDSELDVVKSLLDSGYLCDGWHGSPGHFKVLTEVQKHIKEVKAKIKPLNKKFKPRIRR